MRLIEFRDTTYHVNVSTDYDVYGHIVEFRTVSEPHLASRLPRGDVGQGAPPDADEASLSGLLRVGAG